MQPETPDAVRLSLTPSSGADGLVVAGADGIALAHVVETGRGRTAFHVADADGAPLCHGGRSGPRVPIGEAMHPDGRPLLRVMGAVDVQTVQLAAGGGYRCVRSGDTWTLLDAEERATLWWRQEPAGSVGRWLAADVGLEVGLPSASYDLATVVATAWLSRVIADVTQRGGFAAGGGSG